MKNQIKNQIKRGTILVAKRDWTHMDFLQMGEWMTSNRVARVQKNDVLLILESSNKVNDLTFNFNTDNVFIRFLLLRENSIYITCYGVDALKRVYEIKN